MDFKIDKEFKELIPPLSPDEYLMLEENCKNYRIRDALVVGVFPGSDGAVLIDGHNRYEIARKHNLSFETKRIDFPSREDAIDWIIRNQLGRRNIPKYVRGELILKLKPMIAEQQKAKQIEGGKNKVQQNSVEATTTQKELAKLAGVSHDTIHKVEKIKEKASEEAKQALRRGGMSINQVYSGIVASENETKRKQEERELREAKARAEVHQTTSGKIADFGEAKQHQQDNELIFDEFAESVRKAYREILQVSMKLNEDVTISAIRTSDKRKVEEVGAKVQECLRSILAIQHKIVEVYDEK